MALHQHGAIIDSSRRWRGWTRPGSRADGRAPGDVSWQLQEKPRRAKAGGSFPHLGDPRWSPPSGDGNGDRQQPMHSKPGLLCHGDPPAWGSQGVQGPKPSMERPPAHPAYNAALDTLCRASQLGVESRPHQTSRKILLRGFLTLQSIDTFSNRSGEKSLATLLRKAA